MSYRLGLTGSIGMGKSTTAALFAEAGVPVWDADAAVHRLYGAEGQGTARLKEIVPGAVTSRGVDREALRAFIKADPDLLDAIQSRIHPLVAEDRVAFLSQAAAPIVLCDIPLLFELGSEGQFDGVAVVTTSASLQKQRVLARPGMTEETFAFILSKQMPDAEKRARATFLIDTTSHESARADVAHVLSEIREGLPPDA